MVQNSSANLVDLEDVGSIPGVGKIPWRRAWQPTPVLPGESHGQKSLAGYSSWSHKELDVTEHAHTHEGTRDHSFFFLCYVRTQSVNHLQPGKELLPDLRVASSLISDS